MIEYIFFTSVEASFLYLPLIQSSFYSKLKTFFPEYMFAGLHRGGVFLKI
jgi:hypothetical protein